MTNDASDSRGLPNLAYVSLFTNHALFDRPISTILDSTVSRKKYLNLCTRSLQAIIWYPFVPIFHIHSTNFQSVCNQKLSEKKYTETYQDPHNVTPQTRIEHEASPLRRGGRLWLWVRYLDLLSAIKRILFRLFRWVWQWQRAVHPAVIQRHLPTTQVRSPLLPRPGSR